VRQEQKALWVIPSVPPRNHFYLTSGFANEQSYEHTWDTQRQLGRVTARSNVELLTATV
jgi:hypothetical protein